MKNFVKIFKKFVSIVVVVSESLTISSIYCFMLICRIQRTTTEKQLQKKNYKKTTKKQLLKNLHKEEF